MIGWEDHLWMTYNVLNHIIPYQ